MMKYLVKSLLVFTAMLAATASYGFNVNLYLSNYTDETVQVHATVTYDTADGKSIWHEAITPAVTMVAPHSRNVPEDKERTNLTSYALEYFDILNQDNHLIAVCLSDYLSESRDSKIRFNLVKYTYQGQTKYYCKRETIHS